MWIKDPKTKKKSATLTFLTWTIAMASFKLLVSGIVIPNFITFSDFSGTDFATVVGVISGLYWGRKHSDKKKEEDIPPIEGGN